MLLVTEDCNLRCSYCYEHRKNSKVMSFETAKIILDKHLMGMKPENNVVIEVFGGEAFLNFPLIRKIDDYVHDNFPQINVMYETTTNGTLVHGEIQDWLSKNKDRFFIALSLDGTKFMHNLNRRTVDGRNSFEMIDIEFFQKTWPGCPAKMTISRQTLPYMSEGIMYIDELGFKSDTTLSIGVDWDISEAVPILIKELTKLIDYYIRNPDIQLCTLLNIDFRMYLVPFDENYRFCGAGLDMICYDVLGNVYPCQGFAPVSIGELSKEYQNFDEKNFRFSEKNICKECPLVRLCSNCYAANLQSTNDIQVVDKNLCQIYKICILASAKIQYLRILAKQEFSRDDQLILKSIEEIQKHIQISSC